MSFVPTLSVGCRVRSAFETPRRIAATTTLGLTLLSVSLSGMAPATVSAQSASTAVSGTPASVMCPVDSNNVPVAASDAAGVYTIASDKSTAGYTVQEVLTGKGDATAIGTTDAVIGTILLDKSGAALPCSVFYVDLRTLTTDEDRRDGQVQKVLEAETYPLGTFVMTSADGLTGSLTDGAEHTFTMIGDLTVHNVSKQVTWDATVKMDGDTLTGSATSKVTFADFGMEAPVFGPVASIQEDFQLQVQLVAAKAS